jgi:hypothetical protein
MDCQTLAQKIQHLDPNADVDTVARMCLLVHQELPDPIVWDDEERLARAVGQARVKRAAADEQRAAVVDELQELAASDPKRFSPDQVWVLVRAIKVLSHTAHLYAGDAELDV